LAADVATAGLAVRLAREGNVLHPTRTGAQVLSR
jgi:hypothetical protein